MILIVFLNVLIMEQYHFRDDIPLIKITMTQ